ncbi:MAG: L,D-transpeptidase family protein [Planctomycetes bacterium]|nr:L,D-transpeptidase family protein [Planctomycetota bacterium]
MEKLSSQWLFSEKIYEGDFLCETYLVQSGDTLERIGKRHSVPAEILQNINGIPRPKALRAGRKIKVVNGPFHVRVRRSAFTMDLYLKNTYVKSYQVGLGMPGHETPTGTWIVGEGEKLVRPQWTDPNGRTFSASDPDYPLGSRWIGLQGVEGDAVGKTGFAIHGTEAPEEIGKNASRGCIRLNDGNAIELYKMLLPGLSKVRVFD